jgi:hypothetical protein
MLRNLVGRQQKVNVFKYLPFPRGKSLHVVTEIMPGAVCSEWQASIPLEAKLHIVNKGRGLGSREVVVF